MFLTVLSHHISRLPRHITGKRSMFVLKSTSAGPALRGSEMQKHRRRSMVSPSLPMLKATGLRCHVVPNHVALDPFIPALLVKSSWTFAT